MNTYGFKVVFTRNALLSLNTEAIGLYIIHVLNNLKNTRTVDESFLETTLSKKVKTDCDPYCVITLEDSDMVNGETVIKYLVVDYDRLPPSQLIH